MYIRREKATVRRFTRPARDGWLIGTRALWYAALSAEEREGIHVASDMMHWLDRGSGQPEETYKVAHARMGYGV